MSRHVEHQYDILDSPRYEGQQFGTMSRQVWRDDPKRLGFVLSRYKFAARMLEGCGRVFEVGCADGFGTRIVAAAVGEVAAFDIDPVFIQEVESNNAGFSVRASVHDLVSAPVPGGPYEAGYAIDVIEHIQPSDEDAFVANAVASMGSACKLILGCPSLESQAHASPSSRAGHVNCKTLPSMRALLGKHFHSVFVFGMNDEVVHTGFGAMCHYVWGIGCHPR